MRARAAHAPAVAAAAFARSPPRLRTSLNGVVFVHFVAPASARLAKGGGPRKGVQKRCVLMHCGAFSCGVIVDVGRLNI